MNPETAYEQHTDITRALRRPDSGARKWLDHRVRNMMAGNAPGGYLTLVDPILHQNRWQAKGSLSTLRASTVVAYSPTAGGSEADDELVGVIDPATGQVSASDAEGPPEALMIPPEIYAALTIDQLAKAPTYYVTADMCRLLDFAAHSIDQSDIMPYSPRHATGFAVLATPLELPYGDGGVEIVDAFAWTEYGQILTASGSTGRSGTVWQFTNRVRHPKDPTLDNARRAYSSDTAWRSAPELVQVVADTFITGTPVGTITEEPALIAQRLADYEQAMLAAGKQAASTLTKASEPVGRFQPYLAAFLLLLTQQITAPRAEQVHDMVAKRARKVERTRSSSVTVVDLRRRANGTAVGSDTGRHLENRHPVGGHWKWQPYGPDRQLRKRVFVSDYIRGPEDAPLVIKPKVVRV